MDTEEKKTSENMEEAVRKAVEKAHEQAASEGRDTSCGCGEDAPKTAGESVSCTDNGGETGAEAEAQGAAEAEDAGGEGGAPENEAEEGKEPEKMDIFGRRSKKELEKKEEQIKSLNDQYIRLMAEFDNFRRRTAQEKLELVSMASTDTIKGLLPILDDCERALKVLIDSDDSDAAKEGTELIFSKLMGYLKSKGLAVIEAIDQPFDTDLHEAVAQFPVQEEEKKGKVFDVVQTGYTLNGKVIRFAKVVVGI